MTTRYNQQQQLAIDSKYERILVIAGPGSGKTRTVIGRIKACVEDKRQNASDIVAITFTNAGAIEMQERLKADGIRIGFVGTLHSYCLSCIRKANPSFAVIGSEESSQYLEAVAKEMRYKGTMKELIEAKQQYSVYFANPPHGRMPDAMRVVSEYSSRLTQNQLLDYDLILHEGRKVIQYWNFPSVHLYVDEYQDSGDVDNLIYDSIRTHSRFYVGDPNQSIFSFRGGNINHIVKLSRDEEWQKVYLMENYRSDVLICHHANMLLDGYSATPDKWMVPYSPEPGKVLLQSSPDENTAASSIVRFVNDVLKNGVDPSEIAILARTNAIADEMRQALQGGGVAVQSPENIAPDRDLRLLRIAVGLAISPSNPVLQSFHRDHLPKSTQFVSSLVLAETIKNDRQHGLSTYLSRFGLPQFVHRKLMGLYYHFTSIDPMEDKDFQPDAWQSFALNVESLRNEAQEPSEAAGVHVGTFHGSKGREWAAVALAGVENNVMPSTRADPKEERRLLFVAMTRAKHHLFISSAARRWMGVKGKWGSTVETGPSVFLRDAGIL